MIKQFQRLCIQLFIINGTRHIYASRHINADETTATGSIRQQIPMIACSDERSIPAKFFHRRSIRTARVHHRFLQNMLQKSLLGGTYLVELIHINKQKAIQIQLRIPLPTEINAVRIVRL